MKKKTLVCLAYYQTSNSYLNILYFLNHGIVPGHDYIIVVNGECTVTFPPSVRVMYRENNGFDFGAHATAIDSLPSLDPYDFFIFLNGSVIGPILPPDQHHGLDWIDLFKQKFFRNEIGLLGTTIVCLPSSDAGGFGPRVEGFFWCTDRWGLDLIRQEKTILCQHPTKYSAIVNGEYGLSRCMLRHHRNLGCMLTRYDGIDWRDRRHWHHNQNKHPSRAGTFFGSSINPYEVVFHKWFWHNLPTVNYEMIENHIMTMNRHSGKMPCLEIYRQHNADLANMSDQELEKHFFLYGIHENRIFS